jgi:hypothetical protein
MIQGRRETPAGDRLVGFFEWVNGKLAPALGPATLGPCDDGAPRFGPCPVCGGAMGEHAIDRSSEDVVLLCPTGVTAIATTDATGRWSMLDMPSRRGERVRSARS